MGLAALVLVAGAPAPAAGSGPTTTDPAERKSEVDQERNRLAEHYDETLAEEAHLVAAYEQSRASATELGRQLAVLDDYVTAVQRDLDKATTAAQTAASRRDALREDLRGATQELSRRRADLRATAVSGYVWFGERGTVHSAYGQAMVADEVLVSGFYAGYLNDVQDQRVDAVERQESRVETLTDDATEASDTAEAARAKVAQTRTDLQKARDERAAAKAAADAEAERQRQLVLQVEAKRVGLREPAPDAAGRVGAARRAAAGPADPGDPRPRRRGLRQEGRPRRRWPARRLRATGPRPTSAPAPAPAPAPGGGASPTAPPTTNNAGGGPPPSIGVNLSYPLPGYPIVSKYGWRIAPHPRHPQAARGHRHLGPGGHADPGRRRRHGGRVGRAAHGYGNAVFIDHGPRRGDGLRPPVDRWRVAVGQSRQRAATPSATSATPGWPAGPHLHFEVRVGGVDLRPARLRPPRLIFSGGGAPGPHRRSAPSGRSIGQPGRRDPPGGSDPADPGYRPAHGLHADRARRQRPHRHHHARPARISSTRSPADDERAARRASTASTPTTACGPWSSPGGAAGSAPAPISLGWRRDVQPGVAAMRTTDVGVPRDGGGLVSLRIFARRSRSSRPSTAPRSVSASR